MTEIEQQRKALRIRYDHDDTYHLQFSTWDKAALTYTEAGRLLSGEGAHPTAVRGILARAVDACDDTLLVSFVVGSESFTTSPSVEPIEHDITFSYQGFVILGSWTASQRIAQDLGLRLGQFSHAYAKRHLHGRTQFHYVAAHDASTELVMEAERHGGIGLSVAQALRAKTKEEAVTAATASLAPSAQGARSLEDRFPVLRYFTYEHLPEHLQAISRPFCLLALTVANTALDGANERELAKALDRLLEAKDAAVRAVV